MGGFELQTPNGYIFGEVVSALQKCIRRGLERQACFFALELHQRYPKYLWKRLCVIAYEDVGLGDVEIVNYVMNAERLYWKLLDDHKSKQGKTLPDFEMVMVGAVIALARAKKCRLNDDCYMTLTRLRQDGWREEIPEFALDGHTRKGKAAGKGDLHFMVESARLENVNPDIDNPYTEECLDLVKRKIGEGYKVNMSGGSRGKTDPEANPGSGGSGPGLFTDGSPMLTI